MPAVVAAVDLGASSGRVMVGRVGPGQLELGGGLAAMLALLRATQQVQRYEPAGNTTAWDAAAARLA